MILIAEKCGVKDEEQKHIFECPALDDNCVSPHSNLPVYETLFSDDPQEIMIMIIGNWKYFKIKTQPTY